jgi:type VI protein secretion system component VasK
MHIVDFLWDFILIFLFIAYFMILINIVTDLFSDHDLSGGAKALWIILLIVTWWLGALIYLIVRGGGMAKRRQAMIAAAQKQQEAYIRDVAGTSHTDEIAKANDLLKSGAITQAEFTALKKKILAGK